MFPKIPENYLELSATDLRKLARDIQEALLAAFTGTLTSDQRAEGVALRNKRLELISLADEKDENVQIAADIAASIEADNAAAAAAETAAAEAAATAAAEAAATAAADQAAAAEAEAAAAAAAAAGQELATVGAGAPTVSTTLGMRSQPEGTGSRRLAADYLTATADVEGKKPGDAFANWAEFCDAAITLSNSLGEGATRKYTVARINGSYDEAHTLGDEPGDIMLNAAKMDPSDEIMAAFCPPATPHYDIHCMNTTRRPVFNSLPGFLAPRGRVSIMPSPTLQDITNGYGIWDSDDDANANARKNCATITCGSPTLYEFYGIWRCLTVKNLLWMTYPELVEAWLNRLAAAQARLGEQTLLEAMGAGVTDTLHAPALGYGASVSITTTILNYLALYQETQRWDITENMEAWLPRWVLYGIQMDIARRRRTDAQMPTIPSQAAVEAMFRDAGINPHWFIDTPSWAVQVPRVKNGTALHLLPGSVQILIAPPGMFALIDRGDLSIGVAPNNLYRDNESNAQNQFTFFFESFEGVVKTQDCGAHILDIPVCWDGAQIRDRVISCQGQDEIGQDS